MVTYSIERILQREREEQKQLGLAEGAKEARQAGIRLIKKILAQHNIDDITPETIAEAYGISPEEAADLLNETEN